MAHTLTETDSYSDSDLLVVPDPGDARKAASVVGPLQQIANHLRYCKNRITDIFAAFTTALHLLGTLEVDGTATVDGVATFNDNVNAVLGTVSAGGLSVGTTGIVSTGPATIIGRVGAIVYQTLLTTVPDTGGTVKTLAVSGAADYTGSLFASSISTPGGALQLLSTGAAQGDLLRVKSYPTSLESIDVKDAALVTITTLAPGDCAEFVWEGSSWLLPFKTPG